MRAHFLAGKFRPEGFTGPEKKFRQPIREYCVDWIGKSSDPLPI
jgi:hypothetical protein